MAVSIDSVLLIGFGGPRRQEEVRPFIDQVTRGRGIPAERLEAAAHHYELIGGCSPFNALTFRQAAGLEAALAAQGAPLPVFVGMRNWHPFLRETLAEMVARGCRRAAGVILSAQQTEASWERYQSDVAAACAPFGPRAPDVIYAAGWHDHPLFIEALRDRTAAALHELAPSARAAAHVVFTAHSVPVSMAEGSPYVEQIHAAAELVAARLGHAHWSVSYQSRSGSPRDPWLEPEIGDTIRALAGRGVRDLVVTPVGFLCDHVEVLYDLDIEARAIAEHLGLRFVRAQSVNDHPAFIAMLADVVRRTAGGLAQPKRDEEP